jgi:hypothetical protein
MPGGLVHNREDLMNEFLRHVLMKQIAHAVHEDPSRLAPSERQRELVPVQGHRKPVPVPGIPHGAKSKRKALRITVFAAWTDLRATRHGVPGRIGPLNPGMIAHTAGSRFEG